MFIVYKLFFKRPQFAAKNDVVRNQWYNRDVDAMAATLGAAPVFVDADRSTFLLVSY